jgi:hypothetical protein
VSFDNVGCFRGTVSVISTLRPTADRKYGTQYEVTSNLGDGSSKGGRLVVQTFFCTNACNVRFSRLNKPKKKKKDTRVIFNAVYMKRFLKFLFQFLSALRNVKTDICACIHDSSLMCKWWSRHQLTCPTFMF